jgi:methionine aminopeptidase
MAFQVGAHLIMSALKIMIGQDSALELENPDLVEIFTMKNENREELSDLATMLFVDLSQEKKIIEKKQTIDKMTEIEKWVVYLA